MTGVLLVPFPPAGHREPMAALGARLRADGHTVTVFAESPATRWHFDSPVPPELYATADSARLYRHLFLGDVADMARDIADLALACRAEVIVTDVMMPGGSLAAELTGLPYASLSCCPVPALDAYRTFIPEHTLAAFDPGSTLRELSLPGGDDRNLLGRTSPRLHLILTTPQIAGTPALPPEVVLVGPFAPQPSPPPPPPRGHGDGPPTVVVTASTHSIAALGSRAFVQDRYLKAAAEALGGLPVSAVVTHPGSGDAPANVRFAGNLPHEELFDGAAAVVTHAGWGTVSRALVRGLPLVLVPISGDQPYIAARCADLGAGIALDAETVTAAGLRDAVRAVLEEPRYREAAGALAAAIRAAAPLATACGLITSLSNALTTSSPASEG